MLDLQNGVEQAEKQKALKGRKYTDCNIGTGFLLLHIVFFPYF